MARAALEGRVRDLTRFGDGVVATDRGVVFAPGVLPEERVRLLGVARQGRATRARRAVVLAASPERVEPPCPVAHRCGGCPLMHASPALQARFKRGLVAQALDGLAGAEEVAVGLEAPAARLAYRRRARLAWASTGRGTRLGYRTRRSARVVDVEACAVLDARLGEALRRLRTEVAPHLEGEGELHLALGGAPTPASEPAVPVIALRSDGPQPPALYAALARLVEAGALAGASLRAAGATAEAVFGDPREVAEGADGLRLTGTVAGFSQAHGEVNASLVAAVRSLADARDRRVLELFGGSGNLTVVLAADARELTMVEADRGAAEACRANLRRRGLRATVRAADAETYRAAGRPDVAVLDPPRTGAPGASRHLAELRPERIVYVSCDPPTLRRDLRTLAEAGYLVDRALAFDMFPQTAHVEAVVRLRLRAR